MRIRDLLVTSLAPALCYAAVFAPVNRVAYPPPTYTLIVMLLGASVLPHGADVVAGTILQSVIFCIASSYLVGERAARRSARLVLAPSFIALAGIVVAVALLVPTAWSATSDYRGAHVALVANVAIAFLGIGGAAAMISRFGRHAARSALAFNCFIACSMIVVLFPYTGELP